MSQETVPSYPPQSLLPPCTSAAPDMPALVRLYDLSAPALVAYAGYCDNRQLPGPQILLEYMRSASRARFTVYLGRQCSLFTARASPLTPITGRVGESSLEQSGVIAQGVGILGRRTICRYWEYEKGDFSVRLDMRGRTIRADLARGGSARRAPTWLTARHRHPQRCQPRWRKPRRREPQRRQFERRESQRSKPVRREPPQRALSERRPRRQPCDDGRGLARRLRRASPAAALHPRGGGRQIIWTLSASWPVCLKPSRR